MSSRVFISTECSQCGGILNLEEGTHAVNCPYCSSSFLITGYDKVLSYYIPKNVEERRPAIQTLAYRHLLTHTDHYRIERINLFYLPFYHLRGKIFELATDLKSNALSPRTSSLNQPRVKTSYLDKSFLATDLEGIKLYSLGIRTSVLQLKLFKQETLRDKGKVYPVTFGIDKAIKKGLGKNHDNGSASCVTSRILSIVYAPVWEVNVRGVDRAFSITIDGLGETIIDDNAPFQFLTSNHKEGTSKTFPTISFHALTCPNCGWDIVPDSRLFVFVCNNCHWVWECGVDGFREVRGTIAQVHQDGKLPQLNYLPFWVFPARAQNKRPRTSEKTKTRLFIPAFKVRDLSVIYRLATTFTNVQPELDLIPLSGDLPSSRIEGAVMRWEDARALADLFVCNGTKKPVILPDNKPSRQLVWLPFYEKGLYLRDALLNSGIQKAKIRPPKLHTPTL
jgi:predicted RNA-binding Zn-ribbon protein involved in translation (DUF1610 family)